MYYIIFMLTAIENTYFLSLILPSESSTPERVNNVPMAAIHVNGSLRISTAATMVRIGTK